MVRQRKNTRGALLDAFLQLAAAKGIEAATISAIAQRVGVTDGAIYRHYRSKEELQWQAYKTVVQEMVGPKEHLVRDGRPLPKKLHDWIRLTYLFFDGRPGAFAYVLLTPHPHLEAQDKQEITSCQGRLFREMFRRARVAGEVRAIGSALALCHFTGLMLNVPRLIYEGALPGPAMDYVDEVTQSVWQVLKRRDPLGGRGNGG